ncbi:MAG: cobyrinate a,c-diamide synthase [Clostridiales bacterium]|nr:cobyrinate a,c-diamide synthase [Clostridiales bacterium]
MRNANPPRLLIAAPQSGSGKTMLTCGLLKVFQERGLDCACCKCGPDYIDPLFHRDVLGVAGYNLDSFFLDGDHLRSLLLRTAQKADLTLIEGVMGYYDGLGGFSTQASAYEIACLTDTPVVLIVDGKRSSLSIAALLQGFRDFRVDSHVRGVILNRTSAGMADRLRPQIEKLGLRLYGYVPECEEARLESRHLGLVLPGEQQDWRKRLAALAEKLNGSLDVDGLFALACSAGEIKTLISENLENLVPAAASSKGNVSRRIGVAWDEAFCFYYRDNLDFLREQGWEPVPFSPLRDRELPAGLAALLFGGGYPERFAKELSQNEAMRSSIRVAAKDGLRILAECGGFLYLHRSLEGMDGSVYPMVGMLPGEARRARKRQPFGYLSLFGHKKTKEHIRGHEFHYWESSDPGSAMTAVKPVGGASWQTMYRDGNLLAGFPHLYYRSGPEWILSFLEENG